MSAVNVPTPDYWSSSIYGVSVLQALDAIYASNQYHFWNPAIFNYDQPVQHIQTIVDGNELEINYSYSLYSYTYDLVEEPEPQEQFIGSWVHEGF